MGSVLKFTPGALATSGATVAFYANTDLTGPILTLTRGQEQPPLATKSVQDGNGAEIVTQVMDDAADKLVDKVVPPVYLDGASPTTIYMAELDYSGSRPILSTKQTLTGVDPVGTAPSSETSVAYATANLQGAQSTSVPPGVITGLEWSQYAGADLLDYTDPVEPTAIEAGVYAVTVTVVIDPLAAEDAAGRWLYANLDLDMDGVDFYASATMKLDENTPEATHGHTNRPQIALALTAYIPAGGVLKTTVQHNAADAISVGQEIMVQRIA